MSPSPLVPTHIAARAYLLVFLLLFQQHSLSSALTIEGDIVTEANYAFPNIVALYEFTNPAVTIHVPLDASSSDADALIAQQKDFSLIAGPITASQSDLLANLTVLPLMSTAIAPIYRLDSLNAAQPIIFSGNTLALIFAGNITNWNDPHIRADNPGVILPNQHITVVYQNDSRFFNLVFTTALNKFSPSVFSVLPPSTLPTWPAHLYAASICNVGTYGTAGEVVNTDGAISYAPNPHAIKFSATVGRMINRMQRVVSPTTLAIAFAVNELQNQVALSPTTLPDLTDCSTSPCWPIVSTTYLMLDNTASPRGCDVRDALISFWRWYYLSSDGITQILQQWGALQATDIIQQESGVNDALLAISCDGAVVITTAESRVIDVVGTNRLGFLANMLFNLRQTSDTTYDFSYTSSTSIQAMQDGQQTKRLAIFYESEIWNTTATPFISDGFYLLPSFLTSVVLIFNPQLSPTINVNTTELTLDWYTFALIVAGNVTDWHDPALVSLNPFLSSVLDSYPAPIYLATPCVSSVLDTTPIFNAVELALESYVYVDRLILPLIESIAKASASSSCDVPAGSHSIFATAEQTVDSLVLSSPGAIGYAMDSTPVTGNGKFAMLYPTMTNGQRALTKRHSTPAGLLACASAGKLDPETLSLDLTPGLNDADCWPLTQVVYVQVPKEYDVSEKEPASYTLDMLKWVYANDTLDAWCAENMLVRTAVVPGISSLLMSALESVTSGGQTLIILPTDWRLSSGIYYAGITITGVGLFFTSVAVSVLLRYARHKAFRSASPLFVAVSLLGILCIYVSIVLLVQTPSSAMCSGFTWTTQLGFTLIFSPLFAKSYRIYRIFGRRKLTVIKLSNRKLFIGVVTAVLADIVVLSLWQGVSPTSTAITKRYTDSEQLETNYTQCAYVGTGGKFFIAVTVIKVVCLTAGVMLAFSTRTVQGDFNESKSTGLAIYNIVFALGLIIPLIIIIGATGDTLVILLLFCLAEIACVTLAVIFAPKLIAFLSASAAGGGTSVAPPPHQSSQIYSFYSLSQLNSPTQLGPYISSLEKHLMEARRALTNMKRVAGVDLNLPSPSFTMASKPTQINLTTPKAAVQEKQGTEKHVVQPNSVQSDKKLAWLPVASLPTVTQVQKRQYRKEKEQINTLSNQALIKTS